MTQRYRSAEAPYWTKVQYLFWGGTPVLANEAVSQEEPTPTSVEESVSPIERSFIEKVARPGLFPRLKEHLKDMDPFSRDTALDVNLRTYYFYRDKYDDSVSKAWAIGGVLFFLGRFSLGAIDYYSEDVINIGYAEAKYT